MKILAAWSEEILSVTRIIAAFMFIQHGTTKLFSFPGEPYLPFDFFSINPGLACVLELSLGPLLLIGLFTRQCAFVLSGLSAAAYFMAHAQYSLLWTKINGGEPAVL